MRPHSQSLPSGSEVSKNQVLRTLSPGRNFAPRFRTGPKRWSTIALICILFFLAKDMIQDMATSASTKSFFHRPLRTTNAIANRTLGFQEIFALSLADRLDRRESLLKAANATNMTITILDARRDEQVLKSEVPKVFTSWLLIAPRMATDVTQGWGTMVKPRRGELGTLRSHVMAWERCVLPSPNCTGGADRGLNRVIG